MNIEEIRQSANPVEAGDLDQFINSWGFPLYVEIKHDGERCWIVKDKATVSMVAFNKHKAIYNEDTHRELFDQYRNLCNDFIIEGELCSKNGGIYSYLSARNTGKDLVFYPFDILKDEFENYTNGYTLGARHASLSILKAPNLIEPKIAWNKKEVVDYFNKVVKDGHEGIVVKGMSQRYGSPWLKMKREVTIDAVILGIKKKEKFILDNIARSYRLGLYTGPVGGYNIDEYDWIGDVGSGLNLYDKEMLTRLLETIKMDEDKEYIYTRPIFVLEVVAESKSEDGHLIHPRIKRIRTDKGPTDCKIEQMDLLRVKK